MWYSSFPIYCLSIEACFLPKKNYGCILLNLTSYSILTWHFLNFSLRIWTGFELEAWKHMTSNLHFGLQSLGSKGCCHLVSKVWVCWITSLNIHHFWKCFLSMLVYSHIKRSGLPAAGSEGTNVKLCGPGAFYLVVSQCIFISA